MAILIGLQLCDGSWDNFVLTREPNPIAGSTDVLGRTVPEFHYIEGFDGVPRADAIRLANSLRGIPKARRQAAFRQSAQGLRRCLQGGTMV